MRKGLKLAGFDEKILRKIFLLSSAAPSNVDARYGAKASSYSRSADEVIFLLFEILSALTEMKTA